MARITADGKQIETDEGTRLVRALEAGGVDVSHRCGGFARCTTCRVSFNDGEPEVMTKAEFEKLGDDREDYRLSCQIVCVDGMDVDVLMKVSDMDYDEAGPEPEVEVTPDPAVFPISELEDEDEVA